MRIKEGRRGFVSIEDCVDATIQGLEEYTKKKKKKKKEEEEDRRITVASNNNINRINLRTKKKQQWKKSRKQKREEKQLYGYFKRQTKGIADAWPAQGKR